MATEIPLTGPLLILIRHATRDMSDDGLSATGLGQARTLPGIYADLLKGLGIDSTQPVPLKIKSSPKARTRATLQHLSKETSSTTEVEPRLDERISGEAVERFEKRVESFLEDAQVWAEKVQKSGTPETWVACSHLDWLEHASLVIPSDENDFERSEPWPPMAIRVYVFANGIWNRTKVKS